MKILKLVFIYVIIFLMINCDIFNNPYDPMSSSYTKVGTIGPTGGYIFYDDEADGIDDIPGFRYLEAAPDDISPIKPWGPHTYTINGADEMTLGSGAQNTIDIITDTVSSQYAAHACYDYSIDNEGVIYNDWFLPSKDELILMYNNLKQNDLGGFVNNYYWSSSEYSTSGAWALNFNNGHLSNDSKAYHGKYIRPIRAFNNSNTNQYTVSFEIDEDTSGTIPVSITSDFLSEIIIPGVGTLVKDNYIFQGWNTKPDGTGLSYNGGDTLIIGASDITLYALWSLFGTLGPSGGYVFYDDEADGIDDIPGFRFLEAAPEDISEIKVWGTYRYDVLGADGTAVGTGRQNTLDIITGDSHITNAAHACANYSVTVGNTTYDDWFLPSKDELYLMYYNLKVDGLGGFISNYYWSSSEYANDSAWMQGFYDGGQYISHKGSNSQYRYVRPVRAF